MTTAKATFLGIAAILLWSTVLGLVRVLCEGLGPVGGPAAMYTASAALLIATSGVPKLSAYPRPYLVIGGLLFVLYEVFLSLSIGYAMNSRQAIDIGMVNYLWPSLTVLFAVLFNGQKVTFFIVPGMVLALMGVCRVLGGDSGIDLHELVLNIRSNPMSYGLALAAALLWSTYCTVAAKLARQQTGITLFLIFTAVALWGQFFLSDQPPMHMDLRLALHLLMAAVAVGYGYAAWNIGIVHGNVTILSTVSYFTPVFSAGLAALLLNTPLTFTFWEGALMVCAGSLLCWLSTRRPGRRRFC